MYSDSSDVLCFVDRTSLYNLVNKDKLVTIFLSVFISFLYMFRYAGWNIPPCIPDSHPYRLTSVKSRTDTIISPGDGHIVTRNM